MIRELKTLIAVAQHGTFAAAGQRIGLTQAAVSAQMKRLEAELGVALFERSGRAAVLTQRGQETLQQAQALLALYGTLGASSAGQEVATRVTLGAIASIQRSLLFSPPVSRVPLPSGAWAFACANESGRCGGAGYGGDHSAAFFAAQRPTPAAPCP